MFKEILEAFRGKDLLVKLCEEFIEMISDTHWMYDRVCELLLEGKSSTKELADALFKRDIKVNKMERKIRKQIIEHLSLRPGADVPICLVLMSIVKDAERVGDHCKNLFEVAQAIPLPMTDGPFLGEVKGIVLKIGRMFEPAGRSFQESNPELAQQVIDLEVPVNKSLDALVEKLLKEQQHCPNCVALALTARYLKRISAHLGNIASSVVMPLHKIDFLDEKFRANPE